jgi:hypothetical protein
VRDIDGPVQFALMNEMPELPQAELMEVEGDEDV